MMLVCVMTLALLAGCASNSCCKMDGTCQTTGLYRHVVSFKFTPSTTPEQIDKINAAFAELPKKIDTIRGFEWGTNVSPENLADGFTHCYIVTFDDPAGLKTYLTHPAHLQFVSMLKPQLEKAFVIDYIAR
ncbi:MAG: Dabb family protein [Planctomycetes bacterium]|nr:Dabb family protein [Planctomycetota bacterium]